MIMKEPISPLLESKTFRRAFHLASEAHRGQVRVSGAPALSHPFAVAAMLARRGADSDTLSAAILHDVVEDTPVCVGEIRHDFGWRVAEVVMLMSKPGGGAEAPVMQILEDERPDKYSTLLLQAIYVKLYDRIHNLDTVGSLSIERQRRMADETIRVLYPAALGVDPALAHVLHNLSSKVLSGICAAENVRTPARFLLEADNADARMSRAA